MDSWGILMICGVATAASLAGWSLLSDLLFTRQQELSSRIDELFGGGQSGDSQSLNVVQDVSTLQMSQDGVQVMSPRERLQLAIDQAGLDLQVTTLVACSVLSGLLGGGMVWVGLQNWMFVSMGGCLFSCLPFAYVLRRRRKRLHRMLEQMPDVFDLICRAVRAGNTFWHGVNSVSEEFEAPISTEFAYCHEMHNLGLPGEQALRTMARRTGLVEMKLLAEAVTVQQQAGGNLVEVLDKLTHMIRERFRIHGKIRTLTAEGKMQAWVLLGLAPAVFLLTFFFNPEYCMVLIEWNHSLLLGIAMALEVVGAVVINRLVRVDY